MPSLKISHLVLLWASPPNTAACKDPQGNQNHRSEGHLVSSTVAFQTWLAGHSATMADPYSLDLLYQGVSVHPDPSWCLFSA